MRDYLYEIDEVAALIRHGDGLLLAGEEAVLQRLPHGNWIAGTIPYFMTEAGGLVNRQRIFVNELPAGLQCAGVRRYSKEEITRVYADMPAGTLGVMIAPASSAVGMLQITDGMFAEARLLCIHDHEVARDGPWYDPRACWFNGLYFRTVPSHAIEMTAAWLHLAVTDTLAAQRISRATIDQKQRLAAVIHLCGRERGAVFARRGFWVLPGERCGDHDVAQYLARVQKLKRAFARMDPVKR